MNNSSNIKEFIDLYIFPTKRKTKAKNKTIWKSFVISTRKKKENVSSNIDKILYGAK